MAHQPTPATIKKHGGGRDKGSAPGPERRDVVRRSWFVVRRSRFVVRRLSFGVHRLAVARLRSIGRRTTNVERRTTNLERRTPNVERRTIPVDRCRRHRRDETEPPAGKCLDEPRIIGGVAERGAQLADAVRQAAIEVDVRVAAPEMGPQLLAGHDFARPGQQQPERACRLRLERDRTIRSGEDRGAIVELEDPESVGHSKILRIVTANASRPVDGSKTMTGIGRPRIVSGCARA